MQPQDVMVYENSEAKFTCTATTDPDEISNLKVEWLKDGQLLDYAVVQRVFKNDLDNSLTISGTIPLDTGAYTCMASNGLDSDSWDAQLLVQGWLAACDWSVVGSTEGGLAEFKSTDF
jgi:neuronal cell adhesion protein